MRLRINSLAFEISSLEYIVCGNAPKWCIQYYFTPVWSFVSINIATLLHFETKECLFVLTLSRVCLISIWYRCDFILFCWLLRYGVRSLLLFVIQWSAVSSIISRQCGVFSQSLLQHCWISKKNEVLFVYTLCHVCSI